MEDTKAVVHMGDAGEERRRLQSGENENRWNTYSKPGVSQGLAVRATGYILVDRITHKAQYWLVH